MLFNVQLFFIDQEDQVKVDVRKDFLDLDLSEGILDLTCLFQAEVEEGIDERDKTAGPG